MVLPAAVLVILSVFQTFLGCTGAPITTAGVTFDEKKIPNIIFTPTGLAQGNRGPDHEGTSSRSTQASRSITPTITDVAVALPTPAPMPQHDAIQSSDGSNSAHPASTNGGTSVPSPSHVTRPSHDENKAGAASGPSSSESSSLLGDAAAGAAQDITDAAAGHVDGAADAASDVIGNELFAFGRFRSFGPSCRKTFFGCR